MHLQVVAYHQVTPDHIPAKIYVEETAEALRNLTTPFRDHPLPPGTAGGPFKGNCSDLMASMAAAAASGEESDAGAGFQPSASDLAAVESCLGEVEAGGGASSDAMQQLSGVAVQMLQAFIDSNGYPSGCSPCCPMLPWCWPSAKRRTDAHTRCTGSDAKGREWCCDGSAGDSAAC